MGGSSFRFVFWGFVLSVIALVPAWTGRRPGSWLPESRGCKGAKQRVGEQLKPEPASGLWRGGSGSHHGARPRAPKFMPCTRHDPHVDFSWDALDAQPIGFRLESLSGPCVVGFSNQQNVGLVACWPAVPLALPRCRRSTEHVPSAHSAPRSSHNSHYNSLSKRPSVIHALPWLGLENDKPWSRP